MMIFELEFLFSFVPEARFIYLSIYLSIQTIWFLA